MVQGTKGQTWRFSRGKPVIDRSEDLDHRPRRCAADRTVSLKGARIVMGSVVSLGIFVRAVSFMISHLAPAPQGLKQFDALASSPSYVGMAPSSSPLRIGSRGHLLV
ncbi:hypothetical protein R1flu_003369 [Riccia fluitans]|uniref:Uncharacterized protein n=1 Tax=Riccia fluitans TaxID=41844 RepID=A0ABD1YCJ0_9MARC